MSEEVVTIGYSPDYSHYYSQIIMNQQNIIEELENQTTVLLEQINGFSYISNLVYSIIGIMLAVIAFLIIWKVVSKWFFRGV